MKFIDWFAGIGGFRKGMEEAGHECVGFCEFDKFAVASYTSMHLITEEQREYLATLDIKQRQKEILKEEYRNGEWFADDIRSVDARSIPNADCWCFGFPCQDISVAGKQLGFTGNRSSLFFRVMYLLGQLEEEKRPSFLFIENVKNLLSVNGGWDFSRLLIEMDRGGYDAEWQVLNSKHFGVPQNRERCFIIGHLRDRSTAEIFPVEGTDTADHIQQINQIGKDSTKKRENPQTYRVYETDGIGPTLTNMAGGGTEPYIIDPKYRMVEGAARIYEGGAPTLTGRDYKEPLMVTRDVGLDVIANTILVGNTNPSGKGMNGSCYSSDGVNPTLTTNKGEGNKVAIPIGMIDDQGRLTKKVSPKDCVGTLRSESHGNEQKVVIPVLTPDRANKRQNGRRFKEDGEEAFTLTGQDRHGVAVEVNPEVIGGIGEKNFGKQYREGNRVYDGDKIATALKASNVGNAGGASNLYSVDVTGYNANLKHEGVKHPGIYVRLSENLTVYAVWYPKKQCYVAIRKLTPKECFRLQGWSDDYFEKAQFVNSDSQLYKQAGNGVTVSVIREIAKKIEIKN